MGTTSIERDSCCTAKDNRGYLNRSTTRTTSIEGNSCYTEKVIKIIVITPTDWSTMGTTSIEGDSCCTEKDNCDYLNRSTTRTTSIEGNSCWTEKVGKIIVITPTDQQRGQPLSRRTRVVQRKWGRLSISHQPVNDKDNLYWGGLVLDR